MMTDQSIDAAARHMVSELVIRHMQPDRIEWLDLLARRCPEATLTDREHIAMRAAAIIAELRLKAARSPTS